MGISIENKVALVTGANRGIGKSIVETFIQHGAKKVYLAVRNPESTKDMESEFGDKVVTVQADLTNTDSIARMAAQAQDVEVLVNNAGVLVPSTPLGENAEEALKKELYVNAFGFLRIANAFAEILEKNHGALVQMNSVGSIKNVLHVSTYSASKAAAYSLTQGLRDELGPKGVCVMSVHPGMIDTDMGKQAGATTAASPTVVAEAIIDALKTGAFHVFPDDMAKQVEAAYQTYASNVIMADLAV